MANLKSRYEGTFPFDDHDIEVAILDNDERVVNEASVRKLLHNYEKLLTAEISPLEYQNKEGKPITAFEAVDLHDLAVLYSKSESMQESSLVNARNLIQLFTTVGAYVIIDEVTGYNMDKKIREIKDTKEKKEELSDFNKKLKKALEFKGDRKK